MTPTSIDNRTKLIKDDLVDIIQQGDRISVASSVFSIYAYRELKQQLESLDEFRFIFTGKAFTEDQTSKQQREFYIPRLNREQSLYGTELEIRLRNQLTQKTIAAECADWIRHNNVRFRSPINDQNFPQSFLTVEEQNDMVTYTPFQEFSTTQLGIAKHSKNTGFPQNTYRLDTNQTKASLDTFNQAWDSDQLRDVTDSVIASIEQMYRENAPELIYYMALYRIFNEFLENVDEDQLAKDGTGFKQSEIWKKLYDFQKDAALSIINKLETFNGCILADSVGLGKTFTSLAVIKYYETRNRTVLVLCPKKLKDNWVTYKTNAVNNPIAADHLRYDVLYHTDLSRNHGDTIMNIPIERINWENYDLVVIDESHNFRNGSDSAAKADDKENRYQKLLDKVIHRGIPTKVLMLSATPVNNRFRDLQNQLALAYEGNEDDWTKKLGLSTDIDTVFRTAQKAYAAWAKQDADQRTTQNLMDRLDLDFFKVLDQVTVARSRKHIQRYYDMTAVGSFPHRRSPITVRPKLSTKPGHVTYDQIYDELGKMNLAIYSPSEFVHNSKLRKYFDEDDKMGLTTQGRETGIRRLMATNLLKRFESSVHSFRMTLNRLQTNMKQTVEIIDDYERHRLKDDDLGVTESIDTSVIDDEIDLDLDDSEELEFATQGKKQFALADMDWKSWRNYIKLDIRVIEHLLEMIRGIGPEHDAKLHQLYETIIDKQDNPINKGNRKILVFTSFADTADYLYDQVSKYAQTLGLQTAEVTGTKAGRCTIRRVGGQMSDILACFSPESKERDVTANELTDCDVDILIATDCISEGQNLQDCDMVVNYDIHWNPVRIIQRFGRIDRIGSHNAEIQLVNYWPDVNLDKYLKLKDRVEARMRLAVMTSTGDDDYINEDEQGDLAYRERQLKQMQNEVPDLEEVQGNISITDLGLNEFRMDLVEYRKSHKDIEHTPTGINAVVEGEKSGILFVLRNTNEAVNLGGRNQIHPYYLTYVGDDGQILHDHLEPKTCLDLMRRLCKGKDKPDIGLCGVFNKETKNGKDMRHASGLLDAAVASIVQEDEESTADSFFAAGPSGFLDKGVHGLDDFELICFLAIRSKSQQ